MTNQSSDYYRKGTIAIVLIILIVGPILWGVCNNGSPCKAFGFSLTLVTGIFVVGCAVTLALMACIVFICARRRRSADSYSLQADEPIV